MAVLRLRVSMGDGERLLCSTAWRENAKETHENSPQVHLAQRDQNAKCVPREVLTATREFGNSYRKPSDKQTADCSGFKAGTFCVFID
ncbi:hypothetical protein EVAR_42982_1 [Eumeta japonica]|uniref:Uncharacterized protein n=1 Tax=Eumeta variegata TaxID=151549 RepID=A0A4C1WCQ9_EUMVA|nr:hypothetical protein EVAR_42982_1 [Eumeta japonica]